MLALRTLIDPVSDGINVVGLHPLAIVDLLRRHLFGFAVHMPESVRRTGTFRRPDDHADFVDPHGLRNIDHVVELGNAMVSIDQTRVGRIRSFDPRTRGLGSVHRDGQDGEIAVLVLCMECLPHGQISPAASPGRPGRKQ